MKVGLIVLTLNAEKEIPVLFESIAIQTLQPDQILVIDSSSTDQTQKLLADRGINTHIIPKSSFDHGGTRQLATQLVDADIYIFLTQDVILAHAECLEHLAQSLSTNDTLGCAYGRQLPHANATPPAAHLRLFNYPEMSQIRTYADKEKYGIKTYFNSNSFAAYKKTALQLVGGFPERLISGEDAYVAAKMLLKGYNISYTANARVYHSHNLSLRAEFRRYFSIGASHRQAYWIIKEYGSANPEGFRFVRSELNYLVKNKKFHWIPRMIASTFIKFFAYKLGLNEHRIPNAIKKRWGVNPNFWQHKEKPA